MLKTPVSIHAQTPVEEEDYFQKGVSLYYSNLDESIKVFQQGLPYYEQKKDWSNYVNCLNVLATAHDQKGEFGKSYQFAEQAYQSAQKNIKEKNQAYSSALNNFAIFCRNKGDFEKATELYEEALAIERQHKETNEEIVILINLGRSLTKKGDYYESQRYFIQALDLAKQDPQKHEVVIVDCYISIALNYKFLKQFDKAVQNYEQALEHCTNNSIKEPEVKSRLLLMTHTSLAGLYLEAADEAAFNRHIKKAQALSEAYNNKKADLIYDLLASMALKKGQVESARIYFQKALNFSRKKYSSAGKNREMGLAQLKLAQTLQKEKNIEAALSEIQSTLFQFINSKDSLEANDNPNISVINTDPVALKVLATKANMLKTLYDKDQNKKTLSSAYDCYLLSIELLNKLRKTLHEEGSKEILIALAVPIFEGALESGFALYQNKEQSINDSINLNQLFQIAENSKAILLLESINEISAKGISGIPDSLLQKEKNLKREIVYLENQLTKKTEEAQVKNIRKELFAFYEQHRKLINYFEQHYPKYHELKYNTEFATIDKIQKKLDSDACMIEYFVGNESIFSFKIEKDKATVFKLDKDEKFQSEIGDLRSILSQPPNTATASQDYNQFNQIAFSLYQQLIQPLGINQSVKRICIIPDDVLAYLPFEILINELPKGTAIDYARQKYLLRDYDIAYSYSATLFSQAKSKNRKRLKRFVGFAPEFSGRKPEVALRGCNYSELSQLACNAEEVEGINQLYDDEIYIGKRASKANFLSAMGTHQIAHLATHSCLDDNNPMNNRIFLSDGYISNYDLYNLELNLELTVLSACQTGSGSLKRGEGVISLARGFMHAGCPSVLMSLWSVEDCSTAAIMSHYHRALQSGQRKDEAVRSAKLDFLKTANKLKAHPFYWAPFVQIGDLEPLQFQSSNHWLWICCAAMLLGLFWWWRNRPIL